MDKASVLNAIGFFGSRLVAHGVRPDRVVLFGSWGRGTATDQSDVDIAVISVDFRDKDTFERAEMVVPAEVETVKQFLVPLDVVCMTPEEFEDGDSLVARYVRPGESIPAP